MGETKKGGVPDALKSAIAANLREFMERRRYDPESIDHRRQLAALADVDEKTIRRLLRCGTQPSLDSLARLATALGVETHDLVYKPRISGEYPPGDHKGLKSANSALRNRSKK